jgi:predicted nucleic acid-binding protein
LSLFVDTSAWYAAADSGDRSNARARKILASGETLVTSDHVLVETWILIRHRLGRRAADQFWDGLRGGVAAVEVVALADLEAAWTIGESFPDQDFSLVDMTSFAVMRRLGLERVSTFDSDFAVYRYGPRRDRAFTVVR